MNSKLSAPVVLILSILLLAFMFTTFGELITVVSSVILAATMLGGLTDRLEYGWLTTLPKRLRLAKFSAVRRGISLVIILILLAAIGLIIILIGLPSWQAQLQAFIDELPSYVSTLHEQWHQGLQWLKEHPTLSPLQPAVVESFQTLQEASSEKGDVVTDTVIALSSTPIETPATTAEIASSAPTLPSNVAYPPGFLQRILIAGLEQFSSLVSASVNGGLYVLVGIVLLGYTIMDRNLFTKAIHKLLPSRYQVIGRHWQLAVEEMLNQITLHQFTAAITASGLMYSIYHIGEVPYASALSVLFGLCALIPGIGAWFGIIPSLVILIAGSHILTLIITLIGLTTIYSIKALLSSRKYKQHCLVNSINPLLVILALIVSLQWIGFLGVFTCVPLAAIMASTLATWKWAQHNNHLPTQS